jgi:D-aminoacyl-tRNA deacylase
VTDLVYSLKDIVSMAAAEELKAFTNARETGKDESTRSFDCGGKTLIEISEHHIYAEFLDKKLSTDCIIFLSRHSSSRGMPAFTVHPEGNWSNEAKVGGKPKELSTAAPVQMLKVLLALKKDNDTDMPITYEATHHGPLLTTPSLYTEVGGNEEIWKNKRMANLLARSVFDSFDIEPKYDKIAVGIGGLHYADKFARLALEGKFAFSHIMPRHFVSEVDMLEQAFQRSSPKAEVAVIEWKSLKAEEREKVINKLKDIGYDYVRV